MKIPKLSVRSASLLVAIAASTTQASSVRAADSQRPESPGAGQPSSGSSVEALNEQGAALYQSQAYRKALEKFIEAYAIDHDSNLLFNIARCYEELGDLDAATEKYQAFLAGADEEGGKRARSALERLARAKQAKSAEQKRSSQQEERAHSTSSTSADAGAPSSPGADRPAAASAAPLAPWLILSGGVLVSAAGVVFYALGARDHQRITDSSGYDEAGAVDVMTEREARDLVDSGRTKKTIGALGLGLGGALITTSLILLGQRGPQDSRSASVALSVNSAEPAATMLLRGAF